MISFIKKSFGKCKLSNNDIKQVSGCPGSEVERILTENEHQGTFGVVNTYLFVAKQTSQIVKE